MTIFQSWYLRFSRWGFILFTSLVLYSTLTVPNAVGSGTFGFAHGFGAGARDVGQAVASDAKGNVYIAGTFRRSVDFDPSSGTAKRTSNGLDDIFVAKYSPSGDLIWAKSFGGPGVDLAGGIAVDAMGNVFLAGCFHGKVDFDPGAGQTNLRSAGEFDIFVIKLDNEGDLIWAGRMGGTGGDRAYGIALDEDANVYICGYFQLLSDFNPSAAKFNLASAADRDAFVSKLDPDGNFVWAKRVGGFDRDVVVGMDIAAANNFVYVTGYFTGKKIDFDPGARNFTLSGGVLPDAFVLKLNGAGIFEWAKSFGSRGAVDEGLGVAVDKDGQVYVTGCFSGTASFGPNDLISNGGLDVFVARLDFNGRVEWVRQLGGPGNDRSMGGIALDANNNVYTTGEFRQNGDFNPGAAISTLTSAGGSDIFISRISSAGNFSFAKRVGGDGNDVALGITANPGGNVFLTGSFSGTVDFDPDTGTEIEISPGSGVDVFLLKLKNHAPVASGDAAMTNEDAAVSINVAVNDSDADDPVDPRTVTVVTEPANGITSVNSITGQVTYTPVTDFFGEDTFAYTIKDVTGAVSDAATVTLTVEPINDAPRTMSDRAVTASGSPVGVPVDVDVLGNDFDVDGTIDPTTVLVTMPPEHGTASVHPTTGLITYTPGDGFVGADTFRYTVEDDAGATSLEASVRVDVL